MAVVDAFTTITGTTEAGLTAYFRVEGCTHITIADVLPCLAKINYYTPEYVIGEMRIWDSGTESAEPNNCVMVRVIVYADGWIAAWFDKEAQVQQALGMATFVDAQTLAGFGTVCEYLDKWNGCLLKVTSSSPADSECPDDTVFCIRETNFIDGRIKVHKDTSANAYHFNSGHTYGVSIFMTNGNLVWWGHTSNSVTLPSNLSNRLYRAIYEMWELLRFSSDTTGTSDTTVTKALLDDGGSFTDETTDFNDSGTNDCPLMPVTEEVDDAFYYGSTNKFNALNLNIGQAAVGTAITWEYWNGTAWVSLSVTDDTSGFTAAGTNTATFMPQDDWVKTLVNSLEYFWIRSRVSTASFSTQPLLTQGWVVVPDSVSYLDANLGMYSFEDTAANYCLICGVGVHADNSTNDTYFYNTSMLGKIIYSHSISCGGYSSKSLHAPGFIYFNGVLYLYIYDLSGWKTNGYHIFNIEDIDHPVGVQNSFRCYTLSNYPGWHIYMTLATVLITS